MRVRRPMSRRSNWNAWSKERRLYREGLRDGAESLRMARREDEDKLGISSKHAGPCIDERGLLAFKRAAGDDESQTGGHRLQPAGGFRFLSDTHIELEIAGDGYMIGQTAEGEKAVGVGLALSEHAAETREQRTPEAAQPLVARPGAVRDAGVDDGDGNAAAESSHGADWARILFPRG